MANPERSFGEKAGKGIRNLGFAFAVLGALFLPGIIFPSLIVAAGGEIGSQNLGKAKTE